MKKTMYNSKPNWKHSPNHSTHTWALAIVPRPPARLRPLVLAAPLEGEAHRCLAGHRGVFGVGQRSKWAFNQSIPIQTCMLQIPSSTCQSRFLQQLKLTRLTVTKKTPKRTDKLATKAAQRSFLSTIQSSLPQSNAAENFLFLPNRKKIPPGIKCC